MRTLTRNCLSSGRSWSARKSSVRSVRNGWNNLLKKGEIINENEIVLPVPGSHVVAAGVGGKEKAWEEENYIYHHNVLRAML